MSTLHVNGGEHSVGVAPDTTILWAHEVRLRRRAVRRLHRASGRAGQLPFTLLVPP
jgi:hypothetical protein